MRESIYDVRFAHLDEIDSIVDFLRKYWSPNHSLVKSRALMDYMYKWHDRYNWVVGVNKQTKIIDGLWGVIPTYIYDESLRENGDYWGALLKVNKDVDTPEVKNLALYLYLFIRDIDDLKTYSTLGIGPKGQAFANASFSHIGIMDHYYIPNNESDYMIGYNLKNMNYPKGESKVKEIDLLSINSAPKGVYRPYKTLSFLINKYVHHPIYKYLFWGCYKNDELICILVVRNAYAMDSNVIHVVDCLGDLSQVGLIGSEIQELLEEHRSEYADIMVTGIPDTIIESLGFIKIDVSANNVIVPDYFEPFEQRNVPNHYGYSDEDMVLFRADADQDRPSIIL